MAKRQNRHPRSLVATATLVLAFCLTFIQISTAAGNKKFKNDLNDVETKEGIKNYSDENDEYQVINQPSNKLLSTNMRVPFRNVDSGSNVFGGNAKSPMINNKRKERDSYKQRVRQYVPKLNFSGKSKIEFPIKAITYSTDGDSPRNLLQRIAGFIGLAIKSPKDRKRYRPSHRLSKTRLKKDPLKHNRLDKNLNQAQQKKLEKLNLESTNQQEIHPRKKHKKNSKTKPKSRIFFTLGSSKNDVESNSTGLNSNFGSAESKTTTTRNTSTTLAPSSNINSSRSNNATKENFDYASINDTDIGSNDNSNSNRVSRNKTLDMENNKDNCTKCWSEDMTEEAIIAIRTAKFKEALLAKLQMSPEMAAKASADATSSSAPKLPKVLVERMFRDYRRLVNEKENMLATDQELIIEGNDGT